jgi:hypothetical protein
MFKRGIEKILGCLVILRYSKVPSALRYFYRDTYYCQVVQAKYFLRDYFFRKKYKEIEFAGEFAPELQFVLPFAYWHYKNGTLKKTVASKYTKELYFFSEDHEEIFDHRSNEGNYNFEIPRILYSQNYSIAKWAQVPLKQQYQNSVFVFDKPMLVIANRYNMEWDGPPISYFSIPILKFFFDNLLERYSVVYNRPRPQYITADNSDSYDLNELDWIKENYPDVILMEDLFKENKGNARNFNHHQLMVYANAERFLSIHGGTATLASYFGGINIILSKQGPEHHFGCYDKLYPKFSGATIFHAKTDEEVKQYVSSYFIPS